MPGDRGNRWGTVGPGGGGAVFGGDLYGDQLVSEEAWGGPLEPGRKGKLRSSKLTQCRRA